MFYEQVLSYCRENSIPLAEFERRCGIGNGTVNKWKKRNSLPTLKTLNKIVIFTKLPLKYWMEGEEK